MQSVAITKAFRTPIGRFNGTFSKMPAHEASGYIIRSIIEASPINAQDIDQVIMGQVLTTAQGQNPARQAAIFGGIPVEKTALTINQVCGSGLRSVMLAGALIQIGEADMIIAGGQENMSMAPHSLHLRNGTKIGHSQMIDTVIHDGLWDIFNDYHMGITAENIAKEYNISREEQDHFAYQSQMKAKSAILNNQFDDEIIKIPLPSRKETTLFSQDEFPRFDTTQEQLSQLKPAFDKNGTVTAGNASGINDGAAGVLLMDESRAKKENHEILGIIRSWAYIGVDPSIMGVGPIPASKLAAKKANWSLEDIDLFEINEAFAAQALHVIKSLGLPLEKVNVNGGAIALGHPIGASGARCLVTLLHEMKKRNAHKGLVTLCVGGGMGVAMCIERTQQ